MNEQDRQILFEEGFQYNKKFGKYEFWWKEEIARDIRLLRTVSFAPWSAANEDISKQKILLARF